MRSRYDEDEALRAVERWGPEHGEALALRTYTARLLGADPDLVLHGGGNTSVKGLKADDTGMHREALFVKGSGWDLATIEPRGHVAVDLARLLPLRALDRLSDEAMVNAHRTRLFDATDPSPSVETLLHAFLPHRYIDHSHPDALLAISNLPDGPARLREAFGEDVIYVDYVMPGFALARAAADAFEANEAAIGMVLVGHGLFSWGDTARDSYETHIDLVSRAERYLDTHAPQPVVLAGEQLDAVDLLPRIRRVLGGHWLFDWRSDPGLLAALAHPSLGQFVVSGPLTPDHVLRTKTRPWLVDPTLSDAELALSLERYRDGYRAYFEAHRGDRDLVMLDPDPRVIAVRGMGVMGVGRTTRDAGIAADIASHTFRVKHRAAALGPYVGLPDADLFDMEYWSLEQAKLGKRTPPALDGQVALITGGAGAIGVGVARELLSAGAHVLLVDLDATALDRAAAHLASPRLRTAVADVTSLESVQDAFDEALRRFGGVDIVVLSAGIAVSAPLEDTTPEDFDRVVAVNLGGTHRCLAVAARLLRLQGLGGHIVLVSSKNVLGPGAEFGAYSASKAGAHQLCKVAALELAPYGVRVNLVAPDAVFAEGPVPSGLWQAIGPSRAAAKGVDTDALPAHYRARNLLGATVTGADVGRAVRFFVTNQTPTTGATLPVDGGIAGAFPR
ncbi:MAG: bifunctional aldolase/short-chain dehydrogenase [Alphaproteobacteria bacterium]|nr:bifunctional aldolase/short-chain dehydrogenase [Alphaproteobacteria bacterium]MCB9692864.1 bifunctional aldolase/short-chain dehydrogenase [Alphaproteobacteria bacterium]